MTGLAGSCVARCGRSARPGHPMCQDCWQYVAPRAQHRVGAARTQLEYDAAVDAAIVSHRNGKRHPAKRGVSSRVKYRRRWTSHGASVRRAVHAPS